MWKQVQIGVAIAGGTLLVVGLSSVSIGFGIIGITAGSIAAVLQSVIGNVAAGSVFAIATSLGMNGFFSGLIILGSGMLSGSLLMAKQVNQWSHDLPKHWDDFSINCKNTVPKMQSGWNQFISECPTYYSKMEKECNNIGHCMTKAWKETENYSIKGWKETEKGFRIASQNCEDFYKKTENYFHSLFK